jgi:hypothetical protein
MLPSDKAARGEKRAQQGINDEAKIFLKKFIGIVPTKKRMEDQLAFDNAERKLFY